LLKQREQGVTRRLAQFLISDPDAMLYHDEPIWKDGKRISRLTSAMYGYKLGGAVGLGYVGADHPISIDEVLNGKYEIEVAGTKIPAKVSLKPMYDPTSARIKA
jgi:glycine cleavage system aminomethyltransferase T